jgi:hypothetical protein
MLVDHDALAVATAKYGDRAGFACRPAFLYILLIKLVFIEETLPDRGAAR